MGVLKKLLTRALSRRVLTGPLKRFVFLYHDVSDPDSPQYSPLYSTRIQVFKSQVAVLAKHFRLVPLDELVADRARPRQRLASITFDDGFLSVKDAALPFLRGHGIPCSVFVNSMAIRHNRLFYGSTGPGVPRVYDRKVFLDEADIKDLADAGIGIGNHSSTHRVLAECDDAALREEILENKLYLDRLTGTPVRHFALPFGKREHYTEHVLRYCHSVGHDYVYTTNPSYFAAGRGQRLIPRVALLNESPRDLLFVINRPLFKTIAI